MDVTTLRLFVLVLIFVFFLRGIGEGDLLFARGKRNGFSWADTIDNLSDARRKRARRSIR